MTETKIRKQNFLETKTDTQIFIEIKIIKQKN